MTLFSIIRGASAHRVVRALFLVVSAATASAYGCSVCGCSLSSDWASQGYRALPGLQADVRFEYYDQSDLRAGTRTLNRSSLALPNDNEIQHDTLNRNTWLGLNYVFNPSWALEVQFPYYDRFHSTVAPGDTELSTSRASGLGDLQITGRYQNFSLQRSFGLQAGLKLPTGRFDQDFVTGPARGTPLDRGLQLGTGAADLLMGASYFRRPSVRVGWFAQVLVDQPLDARAGFRPAPSLSVNAGWRYLTNGAFTPQLQVNLRWDGRETGVNADYGNSGDSVASLSPGLTAELGRQCHAFAFVQLPVYQRVNGLQLMPRWLLSLGLRWDL